MFKELYKKVDSKVEPDLKLINDTKVKMMSELKQSKMLNFSFYKYATVAACFIVVIGLCSIKLGSMSSQVTQDLGGNAISASDSNSEVKPYFSGSSSVPNASQFVTSGSSNSFSSLTPTVDSASVSENPIVRFFKNILQWFEELLF